MHYGVGVPNVGEFADPNLLVELAQETESGGWDGFFVWDHLLSSAPEPGAVEPWTVIAAAAAVTRRVRLGVLVTAVPRRDPVLLAQQVATTDILSAGRAVFGAGLGSIPQEYTRVGRDGAAMARGRRLDEALSLLQVLWSPGSARHHGECFTVDGIDLLPKPVQQPHPPIWIAGRWPNQAPFRRAARFDGVMPTHSSHPHGSTMGVGELSEIVATVERHRSRQGPYDVVMEGESKDAEHLDRLAEPYGDAGLTWWVEKLGWWRGGREAAAVRVRRGPPRRASPGSTNRSRSGATPPQH